MKNNTVYYKNLSIIKEKFPALCHEIHEQARERITCRVIQSEQGTPTLQVSDGKKSILVHSKKDPRTEAERFVRFHIDGSEQLIIVVGFGLGYHIESLLIKNPTSVVIIIEPEYRIFQEALKARDITQILINERVFLFLNEAHIPYDETLSTHSPSRVKLLVLRPYYELFGRRIVKIQEEINSFLNKTEINIATLKRFDRLWTKNSFKNSVYFFQLPGLRKLKDLIKGIPAAVICAGPSFDEDVNTLINFKEHIIIIAVDTTLKPLLKRGIAPDFAVTVDPQYINSLFMAHLENLMPEKCTLPILIADPAVYPATLRSYPGGKVITSSVFSPGKIIERFSGIKGHVAAGGSVAVAAFDVARILGSDPIILLGLDLSYSGGKTHLGGSFVEEFIHSRIHRFEPSANYYARYIKNGDPVLTTDKNGKKVFSDRRLLLYKKWFESQSRSSGCSIINATRGGLNIEGFKNIPLETVIGDFKHSMIDRVSIRKRLQDVLAEDNMNLHRIEAFREYLESLLQSLSSMLSLSTTGKVLSQKLIELQNTKRELTIKNELEKIDAQILSFKEENRLLSMVIQSSINEIIRTCTAVKKGEALENSLKLYTSIEAGLKFLMSLLHLAQKKLKNLRVVDENNISGLETGNLL